MFEELQQPTRRKHDEKQLLKHSLQLLNQYIISHICYSSPYSFNMQNEAANAGQPIIEVFLPTFRMEPDEDERFYPSQAKKLAQAVVEAELNGQEFEEDDVKAWTLSIGDKVRDSVKGKVVLVHTPYLILLYHFKFSIPMRSLISFSHTENMNVPRYKIIVQTTIGELKDQGIRVASRCLWDVSTDNYTSVSYTNVSQYYYALTCCCVLCA